MAEAIGDLGCEVNPVEKGCLTCPLPGCRYDVSHTVYLGWVLEQKDRKVVVTVRELADSGLSHNKAVRRAAEEWSLTMRTIYRILERTQSREERDHGY